RVGFEPTDRLPGQRFSRPPHSTALAPLRLSSRSIGGEGGIRTHGRVSPTHAFQACSLSHSDTSPGSLPKNVEPRRYGPRRNDAKKPRSNAALSLSRTPAVTSSRWLSRGSWTRLPRVPQ